MKSRLMLLLTVLSLAMAVTLSGGCSKTTKPIPPSISREDADDIVQHLAAMTASDNGGWWYTIEAMAGIVQESFPMPGPVGALGQRPAAPMGIMQDTTLTRGNVTYNCKIYYSDGSDRYDRPVPNTVEIEANMTAYGGTFNANGVNGTYGYENDTTFVVYYLSALHDTLEFSGLSIRDSSFALVTSAFRQNSARWWYNPDNYFDYTVRTLKAELPAVRPIEGEGFWIIDAYRMPGKDRSLTGAVEYLADLEMSFNGTLEANVRFLIDDPDNPTIYSYRINLKTGVVTKL